MLEESQKYNSSKFIWFINYTADAVVQGKVKNKEATLNAKQLFITRNCDNRKLCLQTQI